MCIRDRNTRSKFMESSLDDFIFIKKLGFGQFGSVFLVKDTKADKICALKCVIKYQVSQQNLVHHLLHEKAVLEKVNFPFVMEFYRTFRDQNFVYFVLQYIKGMELFEVIREIGLLSTYDTQFFIGSVILALEYMHINSIIYRDIKPENIMVDADGYVRLIDMGTAKILSGKNHLTNRTFTIVGTPHYMAPEVLSGGGYTCHADLWSMGVCLYEFMCGMVPFGEDAEDPFKIYEEIIKNPLKYPAYLKDKRAQKLMDQLLNKVPEARLAGGSYASLKAHPFFTNFDWDKLLSLIHI
eukprot:TRINITY_DN2204_c0_g1_i12.p1 TRINITY_DN2204_c0_g1~~TRINITY_DN2204_c0_g1_i12.p1  ORF type:complete len:309 (-),score=80.85 TRINITY_DN2204_c0_g1_i12:62-949(-)